MTDHELPTLIYLGTPEIAVPPLLALLDAGFGVAGVVTAEDRGRGRGQDLSQTPVKAAALDAQIPVVHSIDEALGLGADLGVVVAFGQIIRPPALAALDMVNLHFSLLPRWRGAAPVERAILGGDARTGVCVMEVVEGLDEGGVYAHIEVDIGAVENAESLRSRLVDVGSKLLVDTLSVDLGAPVPQAGEVTYAHKIDNDTLHIDWSCSAVQIERLIRVGGAWTSLDGTRLKIWSAHVEDGKVSPGQLEGDKVGSSDGVLILEEVQLAGKPRQQAEAWLNGARLEAGTVLGT